MLSSAKYFKEFLLIDAEEQRALEYVSELDRDWDYGPVSINQVGDKIQIMIWDEEKKNQERIRKAEKLAYKYGIHVRRVTFK